jgi:hypothetical protein
MYALARIQKWNQFCFLPWLLSVAKLYIYATFSSKNIPTFNKVPSLIKIRPLEKD